MISNFYFKLEGDKVIETTLEWIIEQNSVSKSLLSTDINLYDYKLRISTIFMFYNHGLGEGKPVLFETMIFDESEKSEEKIFESYQERYTSLKDAKIGHIKAINYVYKYIEEQEK